MTDAPSPRCSSGTETLWRAFCEAHDAVSGTEPGKARRAGFDAVIAMLGVAQSSSGSDEPAAWQWRYVGDRYWKTRSGGLKLTPSDMKNERPIEQRPLFPDVAQRQPGPPSVDALINAIISHPAQGWLWFATAPRDGTKITAWHKVWKCPVTVSYIAGRRSECKWVEGTLTTEWPDEAFSHWQPLLAAPSVSSTDRLCPDCGRSIDGPTHAAYCAVVCALCDLEHPLHEDAQGFHHVIKGERVACPVTSTDRAAP